MKKVNNLYNVKATVLPAKVLVLLSKFAKHVKEHDGVVIQLSSLNVFKHVHNSCARSKHPDVHHCYKLLLREVNKNLSQGNMLLTVIDTPQKVSSGKPDDRYKRTRFWNRTSNNEEYSASIAGS